MSWPKFEWKDECPACGGVGVVTTYERADGGHRTPEDHPCPECDQEAVAWLIAGPVVARIVGDSHNYRARITFSPSASASSTAMQRARTSVLFACQVGSLVEAKAMVEAHLYAAAALWGEVAKSLPRSTWCLLPQGQRQSSFPSPGRGTILHPCEYCGNIESGATRCSRGFYRCNACGEPGQ